jgi:SAM-dependent methyltransferase
MSEPDDILARHLSRVPAHRALIRALEHRYFAEESWDHPVLDIGCGDGFFASLAFQDGIDHGIDVQYPIVAEGKRNGNYRYTLVADGVRLPYCSGSFRTVVSNCVIEHIPDIEGLVAEVARVLVPGGRFIFSVPNHLFTDSLLTPGWLNKIGLGRAAEAYGRWWNGRAFHQHLDSPLVWEERLARRGLRIQRHMYYMSPRATRAFELAHYYALPSMVWHRLAGRWSLRPEQAQESLAHRWLAPFAREPVPVIGSCSFFVAERQPD